jgi:hypothetical protein
MFGCLENLRQNWKKLDKTWVDFEFQKSTQTYFPEIIKYNKKNMSYPNMPLMYELDNNELWEQVLRLGTFHYDISMQINSSWCAFHNIWINKFHNYGCRTSRCWKAQIHVLFNTSMKYDVPIFDINLWIFDLINITTLENKNKWNAS